jgi:spermidine/putrescine transport system ATP-binding protein
MNRGVVEQLAVPEEVYERPATVFVAGFIGVSNLLPAEVASVSGDTVDLQLDSGPTVRTHGGGVARGERCHAVVRPEKLQVARIEEPAPPGKPSVEGIIESAVYLGTATQMVVKLAGDVPLTVLVPNADDAERQMLPGAGARVRLAWSPEHMHVVRSNGAHPAAASQDSEEADPAHAPA